MVDKCIQYFKQFDTPVSIKSLGVFRILYGIYHLGLIYQLYANWPLFFNHIPPISISYFPVKLSLLLWALSAAFLTIGWFTRYAAIASYTLTVLMAAYFTNINISSFNDDLLRIGGFLLIVLPAGRSFAIDACIQHLAFGKAKQTTSYLYYLSAILVSLGCLYFASAVSKLFSPMWQHGIGLWIPAVIPSYKWNAFHFFVDEKWLMYGLNYVVIAFELLFVFLLFARKWHWLLVVIGIGFHAGIALLFPFSYISFGPIIYYTFFIPSSWWQRHNASTILIRYNPLNKKHIHALRLIEVLRPKVEIRTEEHTSSLFTFENKQGFAAIQYALRGSILGWIYAQLFRFTSVQSIATYASESWLPLNAKPIAQDFNIYQFKRFVFFIFIVAVCWVQLLTLGYHAYTAIKADDKRKAQYLKQKIAVQDLSTKPSNLARTFFGINSRGLFLDHAFTGSKTVFALAKLNTNGQEEWLPVFTKEGYCTGDNLSFRWHKLSFKYFGYSKTQPDTSGLKKYTWLWAQKKQIVPDNLHIRVYRRIYPCPTEFEEGYLTKMLDMPWDTVGLIEWKDSIFTYQNLAPDSVLIK